jgi:precorrin-6A synthase
MIRLLLVGIGTGNPEHMTMQAISALNAADVIFVPDKGEAKEQLRDVRRTIIERFVENRRVQIVEFAVPTRVGEGAYQDGVTDWHDVIADIYVQLFQLHLANDKTGAFLIWGDPSLYDSTIRIMQQLKARGTPLIAYDVIPGITSVQALAAAHRIPLNLIGAPIRITPARKLAAELPDDGETVVVMLDGEHAFLKIEDLDAEIYWGAYVGTSNEIIIAGRLGDVREEIVKARAEARAKNGWIMDIYAMRKKKNDQIEE